jgi:hypothetical protein
MLSKGSKSGSQCEVSFQITLIVLVLFLLGFKSPRPTPFIVAAEGGKYYFKMIPLPDKDGSYSQSLGKGTCYEVVAGEADKALWTTDGWYGTVHLSRDGKYLVRLGGPQHGFMPSNKDLAISFYMEGQLTKSYSTNDLVRNPLAARKLFGPYEWMVWPGKFISMAYEYELTTIDQIQYVFDIKTGEIKSIQDLKKEQASAQNP